MRELGWDTADPFLVISEYKSGNGRADYALLASDGKPAMMVEAKSLGSSLKDDTRIQALNYCHELGTKHFALTDGSSWEIYETHRAVPIDEKRIVEFDLITQPVADVCLRALALWRPSLKSGSAATGHAPLIQPEPAPSPDTTPPVPAPEPQEEYEWKPLSELEPPKGASPPVEIRFPDNSRHPIKHWNGVVLEVARWLASRDHLRANSCPIRRHGNSSWSLVSMEPVHPNGKGFYRGELVEDFWIEKDFMIPDLAENARTIIKHVGQDPAQFKVRFD